MEETTSVVVTEVRKSDANATASGSNNVPSTNSTTIASTRVRRRPVTANVLSSRGGGRGAEGPKKAVKRKDKSTEEEKEGKKPAKRGRKKNEETITEDRLPQDEDEKKAPPSTATPPPITSSTSTPTIPSGDTSSGGGGARGRPRRATALKPKPEATAKPQPKAKAKANAKTKAKAKSKTTSQTNGNGGGGGGGGGGMEKKTRVEQEYQSIDALKAMARPRTISFTPDSFIVDPFGSGPPNPGHVLIIWNDGTFARFTNAGWAFPNLRSQAQSPPIDLVPGLPSSGIKAQLAADLITMYGLPTSVAQLPLHDRQIVRDNGEIAIDILNEPMLTLHLSP